MDVQKLLESKVEYYNQPDFIAADPISIPHQYKKKEDIEIAGFIAATFAWGIRTTILNKANTFLQLMDNAPYDFLIHHKESDRQRFLSFKHRTFNATDAIYFIQALKKIYLEYGSLERVFMDGILKEDKTVENGLIHFHDVFFDHEDAPARTKKHVATPQRRSTCKRLNMFLRWMVRKDEKGVDFGLWETIKPAQLICPIDVHVNKVARQLGLIQRQQNDWQTALELTEALSIFDAGDPVKYDFALFGMGLELKAAFL